MCRICRHEAADGTKVIQCRMWRDFRRLQPIFCIHFSISRIRSFHLIFIFFLSTSFFTESSRAAPQLTFKHAVEASARVSCRLSWINDSIKARVIEISSLNIISLIQFFLSTFAYKRLWHWTKSQSWKRNYGYKLIFLSERTATKSDLKSTTRMYSTCKCCDIFKCPHFLRREKWGDENNNETKAITHSAYTCRRRVRIA